jgi:hypothetical protein
LSSIFDADGSWRDHAESEAMSRDDAIVEDVLDIGFSGEAAEGGCVVFLGLGFNGSDAEVLVAVGETGSNGSDAGLCISGDSGVAIEDEVAMGSDAGGIDLSSLSSGEMRGEERKDTELLQIAATRQTCRANMKIRCVKSMAGGNEHDGTSVLR